MWRQQHPAYRAFSLVLSSLAFFIFFLTRPFVAFSRERKRKANEE
jgi:cbb3-type cytochrome oxidase subunit 3